MQMKEGEAREPLEGDERLKDRSSIVSVNWYLDALHSKGVDDDDLELLVWSLKNPERFYEEHDQLEDLEKFYKKLPAESEIQPLITTAVHILKNKYRHALTTSRDQFNTLITGAPQLFGVQTSEGFDPLVGTEIVTNVNKPAALAVVTAGGERHTMLHHSQLLVDTDKLVNAEAIDAVDFYREQTELL